MVWVVFTVQAVYSEMCSQMNFKSATYFTSSSLILRLKCSVGLNFQKSVMISLVLHGVEV